MIEPEYIRTMARYNSWQNNQINAIIEAMDQDSLTKDRGAFFVSILATLNHLLWGDQSWMSRFDPSVMPPEVPGTESTEMTPNAGAWYAERFRLDGKIRHWANSVKSLDLRGELSWYSGAVNAEISKPYAECVVFFFNHQIHHRGQVHAMLTGAGQSAPVSDLVFMPEG